MPWVKLDDGYFTNPKIRAVGKDGRALHLAGSCWSASELTDGVIPSAVVKMLCQMAEVRYGTVMTLVVSKLWHEVEGGYLIHDWEDYIKSRAEVEKDRARWAKAQRKHRLSTGMSSDDSHDDYPDESSVESSVGHHAPVPVPVGLTSVEIPPPLPTVAAKGGDQDRTGRGRAVLEVMVRTDLAAATDVRDERAYATRVRTRLSEQHGAEIERLCGKYPDAPPSVIAGHIRGETTSLRYYQAADPVAVD